MFVYNEFWGKMCDTDLVWPWELWLLNLEIKESRQGDGVEKPGSETENSNEEECQTNTQNRHTKKKGSKNKCRASVHLKKLTILWKSPGMSTSREMAVVKINAGDGVSLRT